MSDAGTSCPHRNFSENLLALCRQHGSIAAVCRGLGMNRQQFNKYLSGASFPNQATLEKISAFFKVDAESMLLDPRGFRGAGDWQAHPALDLLKSLPRPMIENGLRALDMLRASSFRPGVYSLYYPWPRDPRMCTRAAVYIYKVEGFTCFTRFTKFRALGQQPHYYLRGRHDGIALESEGSKFMLAVNRQGFRDVSLLNFGIDNTLNQNFLSGLGLVMGASSHPLALRAFLQYRGARNLLRQTIAEACILPLDHPGIAADIREALSDVPKPTAAALHPLSPLNVLTFDLDRDITGPNTGGASQK